jgi:hypothetical protein
MQKPLDSDHLYLILSRSLLPLISRLITEHFLHAFEVLFEPFPELL